MSESEWAELEARQLKLGFEAIVGLGRESSAHGVHGRGVANVWKGAASREERRGLKKGGPPVPGH